jgi:hypothetical protein
MMKLAKKFKGKIAYNFGIGFTKKDTLEIGEKEIIRRVKARNDPQWRFNRDKLVDYKPKEEKEEKKEEKIGEKTEKQKEKQEGAVKIPEIKEKTLEQTFKEEIKELESNNHNTPAAIEIAETQTIKRPEPELTPEEREKIKKIAAGFFAGGRAQEENKEQKT